MKMIKPEQIEQTPGRRIDVRELDEFAERRYAGTECVPLSTVLSAAKDWDRGQPVVVFCKSGGRAKQAAEQLQSVGFEQVTVVEGGVDGCRSAGISLIENRKRVPVYRQVILIAGAFLLAGLILAATVNPIFIVMDYFVAVMLMIAGATGFCPMALLLERMPWNRFETEEDKSCCSMAAD